MAENKTTVEHITNAMVEAALETEFEGATLRNIINAQLWYKGAYGNAKAVLRRALANAFAHRLDVVIVKDRSMPNETTVNIDQ